MAVIGEETVERIVLYTHNDSNAHFRGMAGVGVLHVGGRGLTMGGRGCSVYGAASCGAYVAWALPRDRVRPARSRGVVNVERVQGGEEVEVGGGLQRARRPDDLVVADGR